MKLSSILRGQTAKIAKPSAQLGYLPDAIAALRAKYGFGVFPEDLSQLVPRDPNQVPPPALFKHGKMEVNDGVVVIDELQVFQNGIVVSAPANTNVTDRIATHILNWAAAQFNITFEPIKPDGHFSQLEIRFDQSLADLFAPLTEIAEAITTSLDELWEPRPRYELAGLHFAFDTMKAARFAPGPFKIERRSEMPYDLNLYFSEGATTTDQHLAILSRFEQVCLERFAK